MSFFRDAVAGGADCGPSNPLQNLLKHSDRDPTARHDRLSPQGPSSAGASMRHGPSLQGGGGIHDDAAERFFGGGGGGGAGRAFEMDALRRELESQMQRPAPGGPSMEAAWASLASQGIGGDLTPDEMVQMERSFGAGGTGADAAAWRQHYMNGSPQPGAVASAPPGPAHSTAPMSNGMYGGRRFGMGMGTMGTYGMGNQAFFGGGGFGGGMDGGPMTRVQAPAEGKGKGKLVELSDANWEAEFARIGADETPQQPEEDKAAEPQAKAQDEVTLDDIRELAKEEGIEAETNEADAEFLKSLERTWKNLQTTMNASTLADSELAQWEAQYGSKFADPDAVEDREMPNYSPESVGDFLKDPKPYPYQENNPFVDHPDPFAEGHRLLATGAPLSQAALAFEAACQRDDQRAWRPLGETQAADEKEHLAIRAFEKAVELASPEDQQAAWLALAISYVNESDEFRALATLERWLQGTYPEAAKSLANRAPDHSNPWDRHSRVVDMFLAAARAGPKSRSGPSADAIHAQPVDADVQVGLGVLFYSNNEYDHARDCFEAALGVNPSDFLLWNRLGATLANGGSPEHAIDAYRKALELRSTFTRAIYNLGVSCLNVGCFQEAAEHFLAALSLHRRSEEGFGGPASSQQKEKNPLLPNGDGSDNLWHTLRRAFMNMGRQDLAERAKPGADVESFRKDGFEF